MTDIAARAHSLPVDAVVRELATDDVNGLAATEAERRLRQFGPNTLRVQRPTPAWKILLGQFRSVVVALLFVAAVISLFFGDALDAIAILAVLVLNTVIGFATEYKARRAMEALRALESPRAVVVRDGTIQEIDATGVVPGDIIAIEAGQAIPADARLVTAAELRLDEAPFTGESLPVDKDTDPLPDNTPLADRTNMVYQGTTAAAGSARAVVVATGMDTQLGRIGGMVEEIEDERTPLEERLDRLGRNLVWLALVIVVIVVAIPVLRGTPLALMIETGLALAIAAVPEGLPAVVTITLAVSVRRMARRRALVRRLPAVESLGSATVICTDKTGTLTAGEMTVTTILLGGHDGSTREITITGSGYEPTGDFLEDGEPIDPARDTLLDLALRAATLSSRGDIVHTERGWEPRGDPTESAILAAARKAGLDPAELLEREPRAGEIPFSSERMYAVSFHQGDGMRQLLGTTPDDAAPGGRLTAYAKGAPRRILELCDAVLTPAGRVPLDQIARERILDQNARLARRGLRVLAIAAGPAPSADPDELSPLAFVGIIGMIDPPAPGVPETIQQLRAAGIRTVMLTGDQRLTAEAIADELGILGSGEGTTDGKELAGKSARELDGIVAHTGVFSRVDPAHKLDIIAALQNHGEIVAMLGDGVNDAAALKKADIGVAMGIRGTDVAKEAADVVLLDDRFQTIAAAVEEGRVSFGNIRKFVFYLFSCNIAEILVIFIAGLAGYPNVLLPLQILWLNLITDTFPALSLAFEPADRDVMRRPPREPDAGILSPRFTLAILTYGALITAVTLVAFFWAATPENRVTMAFMTIALAQIFHLANARSAEHILTPRRLVANRHAVAAVLLTIGLQFLAVYLPSLAAVLRLTLLNATEWLLTFALALVPVAVGQLVRIFGGPSASGISG